MASAALTPTDFVKETLESAGDGLVPAAIGAAGAGLGLLALTPFMVPASVPMSLMGMVLALRSGNRTALALGGLGLAVALAALLKSAPFWVVFASLA